MVHSTWGDWFVREEIEATDPEGLSIWYLGCNGFVARTSEVTLYVDPYFGDGDPPNLVRMIPVPLDPADVSDCDAVLVTHEHIDHMHAPSQRPLVEGCDATVYAPSSAYTDPQVPYEYGLPEENSRVVAANETFELGDLTIHVRGGDDPDAVEEVSYVIEHESGTYFNSGDSRPCEAFHEIGDEFDIDVGSLTFGTHGRIYDPGADETLRTAWYMDESQVIEAANALELDRLLPCHYDMWKGVRGDPESLFSHAASYEYPRNVEVVSVGDRVEVGRPGVRPLRALTTGERE